jgi:hypothetical protein
MHYLVDAWDWLNGMLAIPLVAFLAGTTLTFAPFFLPRVRKSAVRYSTVVFRWIVERLTGLLKKTCKAFGIARQEDLDALRAELRQAIKPTSAPAPAETAAPRTIARAGTKIKLNDEIWRYLGREDPLRVDSRMLDRFLHGPFCEKCSYFLANLSTVSGEYYVTFRCPHCSHQSPKNEGVMNLTEFKESVYRGLDAEFQQTGVLKD